MKNKTHTILESILMYSNFHNNEWKKKLDEDGYIVVKNSKYMKKNLKILKKIQRLDKERGR